jgi:hypothetical protein
VSPRTRARHGARRARPGRRSPPVAGVAAEQRIPSAALIVAGPFGALLPAQVVAAAIARGLRSRGRSAEECPLPRAGRGAGGPGELLDELDFDARLPRARAVIVAERRLRERALPASVAFEVATRARQSGVPAYAVAAESALDSFDARMLDLQLILEAATERALAAAGRKLAAVI